MNIHQHDRITRQATWAGRYIVPIPCEHAKDSPDTFHQSRRTMVEPTSSTPPAETRTAVKILITAGPTREPIDAVRVLSNRSSGLMGVAVAAEAVRRGHETTLLLGRGATHRPDASIHCHPFDTTAELAELLCTCFPQADMLIMAAAVADFIPEPTASGTKMSRHDGPRTLTLHPAPDLVADVAAGKRSDQTIIGFALEPAAELLERAVAKLARKGLDAIVANPLEAMESTQVSGMFISADGQIVDAPTDLPKDKFAEWLLDRAEQFSSH